MNLDILNYELENNMDVFKTKEFNQENYPLTLKMDKENSPMFFYKNEVMYNVSSSDYWPNNYWLLSCSSDKRALDVTATFDVLSLWTSFEKIFSDDEDLLSIFLNNIKQDFGAKLGKDIVIFLNKC